MESLCLRSLLVIFGMQLAKCCTLSSGGISYSGPDLSIVVVKDVLDSMTITDKVIEYDTDGVSDVIKKSEEIYVEAAFENNKLTFTVIKDFQDLEMNTTTTLMQITTSLTVQCNDGEWPMNLQLQLKDSDNHSPLFNNPDYKFTLPMPWPEGVSIPKVYGEIWVYDADVTSELVYESSGDAVDRFDISFAKIQNDYLPNGMYFKPYYILDFSPKEPLDVSSVSLTITVKDEKNPTSSIVTTTITMERNPATSIPKSPNFDQQWYLVEMTEDINVGDELLPSNGQIKLQNYDDIKAVILTMEGDPGIVGHFSIHNGSDVVKITLTEKFSDTEMQLGLITLKATVENAAQPGYSVLSIIFPPAECPATTTAEPCTTPETTTTTSTTTTVATTSSTSGIPTTDENFSPTSTEDPCSKCPIITTECPSETTQSEHTASTHPVSKTTPVMKTTTEDPCSSCPTTITDCPTVTMTEGTPCPVCNESTTASTEHIWSTDVTGRTSEASTCPACDCSSTTLRTEGPPASGSTPDCAICTTPEVTPCPTCDCSATAGSSSPTTSCPTCEPCPSPEPPENCELYFPQPDYHLSLHAGDFGVIGIVQAFSNPPLDPSQISYFIFDKDFVKYLKIIEGNLYAISPLEVGHYELIVGAIANCSEIDDKATATVSLDVYSIDVCGNDSDIEVLFPEAVKFFRKFENTEYPELISPMIIPPSLECTFSLSMEPEMTEFTIGEKNGSVSMEKIDREAKIFNGAITPEIILNVTATCSLKIDTDWIESDSAMDSSKQRSSSMIIFVYILDKDDNLPEFANENVTIGYPEKSIAEEEMPTQLGIAEAYDADVGDNAKFTYLVEETDSVIIEEVSGYYYPHPSIFQYKDFDFKIVARVQNHDSYCTVKVKILSQEYLTEIRVKGALVDDAQDIVKKLSTATDLDIGIVSARLVKSYSSKDAIDTSFEIGIFGKPSYVFTDSMKEMPLNDLRADDTYSLRLVVYAFKNGEAVDSKTCQDKLNNIGGPMITRAYAPLAKEATADSTSAVIALSVVLALVILGVIGFTVYKFWAKRRSRDNESVEKGLVDEKNEEIKDDSDFIYRSEKASISSGDTGEADSDDANPERRKSVVFAEETQVIPGDDEESQGNITGSLIDVKM